MTPDELKARITAAKDMLQRIWQVEFYRWGLYKVADGAHCKVFRT
jgi:hypothetical protein